MIISTFILYINTLNQNDPGVHPEGPSMSGDLLLIEKIDNTTYKFELNNTYFIDGPPKLERDELGMKMRTFYKDGNMTSSIIKRYDEEFNKSDDFSFTYFDEDGDGMITERDTILVKVYLDISYINGFDFRFNTKNYGGDFSEYDRSEELP